MAETIVVETLLKFGLEKLCTLLDRQSTRLRGVEGQIDELKRKLMTLRGYLEDPNSQKLSSVMLKNTRKEIREIVYDAEDTIETFLLKEELGKRNGIKKRIEQLACVIPDSRGLAFNIEDINKRISKVILDMQTFGVQQTNVSLSVMQSIQERKREILQRYPNDNEDHFVGLENNVEQLVSCLMDEASNQVVSIIGMGGVGKTTLAQQVFNHEMVKNHFDGVAWVCISQQFTTKDVWQTILQMLSHKEHTSSNMTDNEIHGKLFQLLETRNCLIVLDDMWKEEDWDRIKHVFPSKKGWKVLLTSRNEDVALHVDPTCFILKPECLTDEESWTLFHRIAFPRKDSAELKVDVEMEDMGKLMIKRCGGLPLAVKVLGGLLATKHTLSEWKRVYDNIGSFIVGDTSISSVDYILSLSFEELPMYLKHCFLYFAHFPEDFTIYFEDVDYHWAAEGIPRPSYYENTSIREVADGYLEELVKRNMVISKRDDRTSRFETCQLHDVMREVCLRKAEEENFVHIVDATATSQSSCNSRRIAVHDTSHLKWEMLNPKLRSLLFINTGMAASGLSFTRVQLMRVLDLSYAKFEGGKIPSSIGKLIHLRYLNLNWAEVSHLPSSMRNLTRLLYLNLNVKTRSPLYMAPNSLNEMRELTYLSLPRNIHYKVKLELGNLVNLETLVNFSTEHNNARDLHRMTRLETLSIYEKKSYDGKEDGFVLDCASHLKQLCLTIDMQELPDKLHFPSRLTKLSLWYCRLTEDPMPILGKLLNLKEVFLGNRSFVGRRMVCSGSGFPQLQKLSINGLTEWEEWIVEEGSMPLLHTLNIFYCPKFKGPSVGRFPQLHSLELDGLEELEEWIVEEGSMPLLRTLIFLNCPRINRLSVGRCPQLQKLLIIRLREWEEWIVEEGSMPLLHTLKIDKCPKLKRLAVGEFPQLQKLSIKELTELEEWIVEEGSMPLLHTLKIHECPKLKRLPGGEFPQLQKLSIWRLMEWEDWIVEEGSMPLLRTLRIHDCPKLKKLPDGLQFIYSLKELDMDDEWEERLSEGGEEYYKVQHIPLVLYD